MIEYYKSKCLAPTRHEKPIYIIKRLAKPFKVDAAWNKDVWSSVDYLEIDKWMKIEKPLFAPETKVKLRYTKDALYIIFRVQDRYVKAQKTNYQDIVSKESSVEFFFCPNPDSSNGFFNLELNCGGTFIFRFQKALRVDVQPVDWQSASKIEIVSSLPKVVFPEIVETIVWTLEIKMPFEILEDYCPVHWPSQGTFWLANFTKTAQGETSNTHYFTWSEIPPKAPKMMFGQPEYFGRLIFE